MIVPAVLAGLLAAAGVAEVLAGAWLVRRFADAAVRHRPAPARWSSMRDWPPITVLKPLYGDEPLLEAALESICRQDYPVYQIVFGVQDPADPARAVAERIAARFPDRDITIVVEPMQHGANRKIGNLINMYPHARHDVLVLADSDLHTAPDYLCRAVAALDEPGVGLVTTLYGALPAGGESDWVGRLVGRLGALQITETFLPGALLARALGRQDCLGATMMLRRETLERVGGLVALADHLADDHILGLLVRGQGLRIALADTVPVTTVPERRLRPLLVHELRWARTIRALVPASFVASAVQYPLAWALVMLLLSPSGWAAAFYTLVWLARG
ncbi:bacteriohopanetetrol glucosamine biosynthesis glycosyltransferase HpnI, partial [Acidisphaera rubrifaciens]|uniref:bacteriohopanetetrol glucosamine biosynthesis glycosyltransferase HpnI n=1 Tax=Acidisphaera rubrifaciens TaxID=50715 RepID=UPI000AD20F8D